jgi:tetratricopeptide (TPR) repeat protein
MNARPALVCAVTVLIAVGVYAEDLPEEVRYLEALEGDQKALVDAARRYHLQQQTMLRWDKKLADDYARRGENDLAQEKGRDIVHRIDVLEKQWNWILDRYPNDARANNYYGELLYDYAHEEDQGLQMWLKAVALDENCAPAHNNLGIHYFHNGNYAEGLSHLQRALKLEEDNPDFLYNMAQMYLIHFDQLEKMLEIPRQKLYEQAMEMSKKAADVAPDDFDLLQDYAVNFYAAENFGLEANWRDAALAWERTVPHARTEDERYYALLNVARAWMRASMPENAVGPLEDAIALNSESDIAKQLLAKARSSSN